MGSVRAVAGLVFVGAVAWVGYQAGVEDRADSDTALAGSDGGCVVKVRQHGGYTSAQLRHARTIAQVGVNEGVGRRGVVIALATAMQESGLASLPHLGKNNDHDSLGLFQQRRWWGTAEQRQTPSYAARAFYEALKRVDGWRGLPLTVAAQRVQRSAYPDAYAKHEPAAQELAGELLRECR